LLTATLTASVEVSIAKTIIGFSLAPI